MADGILTLSDATFAETIGAADTAVVVDFWAEWCGPCKMIAPVLEDIASSHEGRIAIAKVNVDDNGDLAAEHGVRAIPTMLLFKDGQKIDQFVGMMDKASLKTKLAGKI